MRKLNLTVHSKAIHLLVALCANLSLAQATPRAVAKFVGTHDLYSFVPSPKGTTAAFLSSGDHNNKHGFQVQVRRTSSGKVMWTRPLLVDRAYLLAFSPDARFLVAGGTNSLQSALHIYDARSGRELRTLILPRKGYIHSLALSKDGSTLAVGGNSWIELWNYTKGRKIGAFGTDGEVTSLNFSPDGKLLASAALWSGATLWNVRQRKRWANLPYHQHQQTYNVAFSPNGQRLALAGNAFACLYDIRTQKQVWDCVVGGCQPSYEGPSTLAFSTDGLFVCVGGGTSSEQRITLLDAKTGGLNIKLNSTMALAFDPTHQVWAWRYNWPPKEDGATTIGVFDNLTDLKREKVSP